MKTMALLKDNIVVGIATGDSLGEPIPAGTSVGVGWLFEKGKFIEPPDTPMPPEQLAAIEREWRDAEVSSTEWLVTRHRDEQDLQRDTTLTADQFAELLTYRQALRDWPVSEQFPAIEYRPEQPSWLPDQVR